MPDYDATTGSDSWFSDQVPPYYIFLTLLVIYLVPFVLLGILWFQVLRRRRAASAGR